MFIYFPEFLYKHLKNYAFLTFNDKVNENTVTSIFDRKMKDQDDSSFADIIRNFDKNKLRLPEIKFKHCNNLFSYQDIELNPGKISKYDRIENKIEICKNMIISENHLEKVLLKELSYAEDLNIKFKGKTVGINDYALMSIKACVLEYKKEKDIHSLIKKELVRRCAMLDLKFKFNKEIRQVYENIQEKDHQKIIETVKKLIDQNI